MGQEQSLLSGGGAEHNNERDVRRGGSDCVSNAHDEIAATLAQLAAEVAATPSLRSAFRRGGGALGDVVAASPAEIHSTSATSLSTASTSSSAAKLLVPHNICNEQLLVPAAPWKTTNNYETKRLGICSRDRKVYGDSMSEILKQLKVYAPEVQPIVFGDDCILNRPVEEWPVVDYLICFHTHAFPTDKALAYIALRQPKCLNDVSLQTDLLSRKFVYETLRDAGIPCPEFIVVDHNHVNSGHGEEDILGSCVEEEDWITYRGKRLYKPLVEKPVSAEEHDINVYYPQTSYGGGVTKIFRKRRDEFGVMKSSRHFSEGSDATITSIRRDGTYLYEKFYHTSGVDLKVYAVGVDYVYAEARKAPVVDGVVEVDELRGGKEKRYPIKLTQNEKRIVADVVRVFRQAICGIDLLRHPNGTVVVDVNGLSFVKKRKAYFVECAYVLGEMLRMEERKWWESGNVFLPTDLLVNARRRISGERAGAGGLSFQMQSKSMEQLLAGAGVGQPSALPFGAAVPAGSASVLSSPAKSSDYLGGNILDEQAMVLNMTEEATLGAGVGEVAGVGHPFYAAGETKSKAITTQQAAAATTASTLSDDDPVVSIVGVLRAAESTPREKVKALAVNVPELHALLARKIASRQSASRNDVGEDDVGKEVTLQNRADLEEVLRILVAEAESPIRRSHIESESNSRPQAERTRHEDSLRKIIRILQATLSLSSSGVLARPPAALDEPDSATKRGAPPALALRKSPSTIFQENNFGHGIKLKLTKPVIGVDHASSEVEQEQVVNLAKQPNVCLVLKSGNHLTDHGCAQAELLGRRFGTETYKNEDVGLMHSNYRHQLDLKVNDDGCQLGTAAVFTKALLRTSGSFAQTAIAYVRSIGPLHRSNAASTAKVALNENRARLYQLLNGSERDTEKVLAAFSEENDNDDNELVASAVTTLMRRFGSLRGALMRVAEILRAVSAAPGGGQDEVLVDNRDCLRAASATTQTHRLRDERELKKRWRNVRDGILEKLDGSNLIDVSLFPTLHWMLDFDYVGRKSGQQSMTELLGISDEMFLELHELVRSQLAPIIIPGEFGLTRAEKVKIARLVLLPYLVEFRSKLLTEELRRAGTSRSTAELRLEEGTTLTTTTGGAGGGVNVINTEPLSHEVDATKMDGQLGLYASSPRNSGGTDLDLHDGITGGAGGGGARLQEEQEHLIQHAMQRKRRTSLFFTRKSILLAWLHLLLYFDPDLVKDKTARKEVLKNLHTLGPLAFVLVKRLQSGTVVVEFSHGVEEQPTSELGGNYRLELCRLPLDDFLDWLDRAAQ